MGTAPGEQLRRKSGVFRHGKCLELKPCSGRQRSGRRQVAAGRRGAGAYRWSRPHDRPGYAYKIKMVPGLGGFATLEWRRGSGLTAAQSLSPCPRKRICASRGLARRSNGAGRFFRRLPGGDWLIRFEERSIFRIPGRCLSSPRICSFARWRKQIHSPIDLNRIVLVSFYSKRSPAGRRRDFF